MTREMSFGVRDASDDDTPPLGFPSPYGPVSPGAAAWGAAWGTTRPGPPTGAHPVTAPWGATPWGQGPPTGGPYTGGPYTGGPYTGGGAYPPHPQGPGGPSPWAAPRRRRRTVVLPLVVALVTGLLVTTGVLLLGQRGTTTVPAAAAPATTAPATASPPPAVALPPAAPPAGSGDLAERANRNRVGFAVTRLQSVVRDATRATTAHRDQPALVREDFRTFARGVEAFAVDLRGVPATGALKVKVDGALPAADRAAASLATIGTSTDRAAILEVLAHVDTDVDALVAAAQSLREP